MSSPLRSPRLRRILVAYTVNRLGTWFGLVALSLAVFDHTHSALAVAALLFAGQALPAFVVPAIVARVEASRRRRELSALYFFEALVTAGLAVLLWHFSLPAVLVLVALDGTAALAASALLRSELARTARAEAEHDSSPRGAQLGDGDRAGQPAADLAEEAERRANAALNVAFSITFVLGPVIGGAVVAAAGAPAALFIDVGSFVICGALLLDLHPHVEEAGSDSVRARLQAAWRHINEAPSLRALFMVEAIALVFFESGGPIEVAYAKATLHAGDRGYGLLLTTWGAGALLGSIVFARLIKRSLAVLLRAARSRSAARTSASLARRHWPCVPGRTARWSRQRPSVAVDDQHRPARHPQAPPGPHDGRAGIAGRTVPGDRPAARRRAGRPQFATRGVSGRRRWRGPHDGGAAAPVGLALGASAGRRHGAERPRLRRNATRARHKRAPGGLTGRFSLARALSARAPSLLD